MDLKDIIIKPLITEKSLLATGQGKYTFAVARQASKLQIREALKKFFKVDALVIHTQRIKGKVRRGLKSRQVSQLPVWKKAIITLKEGQKIDAFEVQEN